MKYQILYASEPDQLTEQVQEFLDAGWTLNGPLVMAYGTDSITHLGRVLFAREVTRQQAADYSNLPARNPDQM